MGNPLKDLLLERIRASGPMTFAEFMQQALYHPEHGYYQRGVEIGKSGDFYTSPHVSAIFGRLIGKQLREMWEVMGRPERFTAIEMGAGHGFLARDVLDYADEDTGFSAALNYRIIEASEKFRSLQEEQLGSRVSWFDSFDDSAAQNIEGCFFSNELVDSFAVHRVTEEGGQLLEIYVGEENGRLTENAGELSDIELLEYFQQIGIQLPQGIRTEVNLEMVSWIEMIARSLKRGFVLTIDYGFSSGELYSESRMGGTIRSYKDHQLMQNPLEEPGERDITAHVDFTGLSHFGQMGGLKVLGYTDQGHFLMGVGESEIAEALNKESGADLKAAKKRAAIMNLIHPATMGAPFKVLIQGKGVGRPELSGIKNARGWKL